MNNTVLAVCYDFDKTLSPDDMQAQGLIQSLGYSPDEFWRMTNSFAQDNKMDSNLAYMYHMVQESRGKKCLTRECLRQCGEKITFFKGVEDWFDRINSFGKKHGITVEHYIISSGLKEMIEGTSIQKNFKKIFACSFCYDSYGVPVWPAQVVNYTNKTQYLFRIEKGKLDVNDDQVNSYMPEEERPVPFRNIVYIGDSETDIPCMTLVNKKGGHSIGVFNPSSPDRSKVYSLVSEKRIKYFAPADYSEGSELDRLIKSIIIWTEANEDLTAQALQCKKESTQAIEAIAKASLGNADKEIQEAAQGLIDQLNEAISKTSDKNDASLKNELANAVFQKIIDYNKTIDIGLKSIGNSFINKRDENRTK